MPRVTSVLNPKRVGTVNKLLHSRSYFPHVTVLAFTATNSCRRFKSLTLCRLCSTWHSERLPGCSSASYVSAIAVAFSCGRTAATRFHTMTLWCYKFNQRRPLLKWSLIHRYGTLSFQKTLEVCYQWKGLEWTIDLTCHQLICEYDFCACVRIYSEFSFPWIVLYPLSWASRSNPSLSLSISTDPPQPVLSGVTDICYPWF